jgi:hypothetical protein
MKNIYVLSFAVFGLLITSCIRKGCVDPLADNYDKKAKKERNKECKYSGEETPPCGVNIEFCMEFNGVNKSGNVLIEYPTTDNTRITFIDSSGVYEDLIFVFVGDTTKYSFSTGGEYGTFDGSYFKDGETLKYVESGQLEITADSQTKGISGNFNFNLQGGIEIKNGFLFRAK